MKCTLSFIVEMHCDGILLLVQLTSSSDIAERLRCRVGQFLLTVEDDILQTL